MMIRVCKTQVENTWWGDHAREATEDDLSPQALKALQDLDVVDVVDVHARIADEIMEYAATLPGWDDPTVSATEDHPLECAVS